MGYLHIDNLYKHPNFLKCYALEKVHGTSAHISFANSGCGYDDSGDRIHGDYTINYYAGGEKHEKFVALFDQVDLLERYKKGFENLNQFYAYDRPVTLYGEAFGGKQQGMSATYGPDLRFMVFDVKVGDRWINVPRAKQITEYFGLEFVPYEVGPMTIEWLDSQRDRDSLVSPYEGKIREGIVIRQIYEDVDKYGGRHIYKYKRAEFTETKTLRVVTQDKIKVLADADEVAEDWVTPMRLSHVLGKTPFFNDNYGEIIKAMQEDVQREGEGEIVWSKDVAKAIGRKTVSLLKEIINNELIVLQS